MRERKGRQRDSVVCVSLLCLGFYSGTLPIPAERMSLLEGERATGNEYKSQGQMKEVKDDRNYGKHFVFIPSHFRISTIQMIWYKK